MKDYTATNLEIRYKWFNYLYKEYIFNIPIDINLLEKTKIIKKNILLSLDTAYKLATISKDKEIFDTTASINSIEKEISKIKKDVVSIAVFGQMSSGKSSFLNSLVGEKLLAVAEERATATITIVRHIDNFEGQNDGDIEIHYKTKNEILFDLINAIEGINSHLPNKVFNLNIFPDNIDDILLKKDEFLEELTLISHKDAPRKDRKLVKSYIDSIQLILQGIGHNRDNLGKVIKKNKSNHNDFLTSKDLSVFLNHVIFYKNIELLKNIEFIDTPGLGSNSQLDTRKSEEFIEKADIVMIITDAKEPMQKESELDILYILEDIQKNENNNNFFDKVFIIINKIDDTEKNRDEIKDLLDESLNDAEVEVSEKNILFVSSLYEYTKRFKSQDLESLYLKNRDNLGKKDLLTIEKMIYDFSAAEATSKFITENIDKINKIFNDASKNFKNNITKLDGNIEEIEEKIKKFKDVKEQIGKELKDELEDITENGYRDFQASSRSYVDDILNEISNEKYYVKCAKESEKFKDINSDNYKEIAKQLMKDIIEKSNIEIEKIIKNKVFTTEKINNLNKQLQEKTTKIQEKYENDYGVILNLDEIKINPIKINLSNNIDLDITLWKSIKQFFNPSIWGKEDKYIDSSAESWEKYSHDTYKKNLINEIKNKTNSAEEQIIGVTNKAISEIIDSIESQLMQELRDYKRYEADKLDTIERKEIVQDAFNMLQKNYIEKAKEQNINLFK